MGRESLNEKVLEKTFKFSLARKERNFFFFFKFKLRLAKNFDKKTFSLSDSLPTVN